MGKDRINKNINLNLLLGDPVYLNLNYKIVLMKYKLEEIKVRKDVKNPFKIISCLKPKN